MSNSNYGGALTAIVWIVFVVVSILSGTMAWGWLEPDSFGRFIGFLLIWAVLSSVGRLLAMGIVALIALKN
ncbi:MAG: hypothetical protein JXR54_04070 [Tannerellaceae bacterium]|nr:hypothetical protein [Tannerellaceae bacterium]